MVSEHTLTWAGQEGRECEPQLLRFHTFRIKVESSDICRFLPNYSHTSAPIYSTIILIKCFITVHFRNQKSISLKPISSHYSLSFILLIIPTSLFLLPEDIIYCSLALSPLYNYGSNFSHSVVILNRSILDSQKYSNLVSKLYSGLGYNYWCLQQANTILSISNILIPYFFSLSDITQQPILIIHSQNPTLNLLISKP